MIPEGCPSGQREQTVNLSVNAYGGSNPPPSMFRLTAGALNEPAAAGDNENDERHKR